MQNTPTNPHGLLALLHLTDSALPTGGFSHSFGLEMYMQRDIVVDTDSFATWLHGFIRQSAYGEGLLARLGAEVASDQSDLEGALARLEELDRLAHVTIIPRQIRDANKSMGMRMARIAPIAVKGVPLLDRYAEGISSGVYFGCPALVFGVAMGGVGFDSRTVARTHLMQLATSINQNAIRGIPLGQDAGQQVLASAYPVIEATASKIMQLGMVDLGAAAPGLELAQMAHETRHSRMFMS